MKEKNVFEVAKKSGELYVFYEEMLETTENRELIPILEEITKHLSESRSKLLMLGKYLDDTLHIGKEAINIISYKELSAHSQLTVVYEYTNGFALVIDSSWNEHYVPQKILQYKSS